MVSFWYLYQSVNTFLFLITRLTTDTVLLDVQGCIMIAQEYEVTNMLLILTDITHLNRRETVHGERTRSINARTRGRME